MSTNRTHLRTVANQDGAAILDTRLGTILTLNFTGAYVWQALGRGEAPETIAMDLSAETGEQLDSIERDVREFIEALKEQHLLPY